MTIKNFRFACVVDEVRLEVSLGGLHFLETSEGWAPGELADLRHLTSLGQETIERLRADLGTAWEVLPDDDGEEE